MHTPRVSALFPLLVAIGIFLLGLLPGGTAARSADAGDGWCGDPAASDWVCRAKGFVVADEVPLQKRRATPIGGGTRVVTGPRSLARLTFQNQASCTLGNGEQASEIYTRWPRADSLFTQNQGGSSCTSLHGGVPIRVLCKPGDDCNAEVRVRGTALIKISGPAEVTTSSTVTVRRWARIVVCGGFVRVAVENEWGRSMSAGGSSGTSRYVIVIEERSRRTEEGGVVETEESLHTSVDGRQEGPGSCKDPGVQEQVETVES